MGSWIEELRRRESAAGERVEGLRRQIAELSERLAAEEELLSRLVITRETMTEILTGAGEAGAPEPDAGVDERQAGSVGGGSPVGVVTVPSWRTGLDPAVLPVAYRDVLEVLADAGRPLRARDIAAGLGLGEDAAQVEGLRSKLKRLVRRGWLVAPEPGLFASTVGSVGLGVGDHPPARPPGERAGSSFVGSRVQSDPNRTEEEPDGTVRHERGS